MRALIFSGVLAVALSGCSTSFHPQRAATTTPASLRPICRGDTVDHLAYMGRDTQFHYVFHSQLFGGGTYRVPVTAWYPRRTFDLGKGEPYVLHRPDLMPSPHS